jgi:hypothetical protein
MDRVWLVALLALACTTLPDPPAPGTSQVFGDLRLLPHEGVTIGGGGSSYGDRRLGDVRLVDYSQPGFAVVYVSGAEPPAGLLELSIRESRVGPRIDPPEGAVGASGRIAVTNRTSADHLVSYPAASRVERLPAGERLELAVARPGEQSIFLLSAPEVAATVFAAPGPFTPVSTSGRFALTDLAPGETELRVWHPRFPPAMRRVDLRPDAQLRIDFELGVGRSDDDGHAH